MINFEKLQFNHHFFQDDHIILTFIEIKKQKIESSADLQFKNLSNVIRFSASVEREIFKTIRTNLSPTMTQFEIISTVLDQNLGIKKNFTL